MGRSANIDQIVGAGNSILLHQGQEATCNRRWAKRWLKYNDEFLKTMKTKPLEARRRAAHQKQDMEEHFPEYKRCRDKWGILLEDIYNFDETRYMIGMLNNGSRVIIPTDCEEVFIDNPSNRELVTATECCSIVYHVPPMITHSGASHLRKYFSNDMNGNIFWTQSETGFVNDRLTLYWLNHSNKFIEKRTKDQYRMLISDGYGSHVTQDFINYCWEHKIRPYQLWPHTTHLCQPLDLVTFQTSKHFFRKALREEVFKGQILRLI
ncbi:hypothetical protein K3495_g6766 [Podosphaera aphanis]|nr:hypothetical protein K3495_g6766 [Podosphaera aphanis]